MSHSSLRALALAMTVMLVNIAPACDDHHGHGHGHGHSHGHGHQGSHGHAKKEGAHGHGHADNDGPRPHVFTHFTAATELFMELPQLVVGQTSTAAAHVTVLSNFRPLAAGSLTIELTSPGSEARYTATKAEPAGIFRPAVQPKVPGTYTLSVLVEFNGQRAVHRLGSITVHARAPDIPGESTDTDDDAITFLKEQQWKMAFGLAAATQRPVRPSFDAYGTLVARPDADVHVSAPVAGRLLAPAGMPQLGDSVVRGQVLAGILPQLEDVGDLAALKQALDRATIARKKAHHEVTRLTPLVRQGAAAHHEIVDARFALQQATAAENAARARIRQARQLGRTDRDGDAHSLPLRSPIDGRIARVNVSASELVGSGAHLFRVVDLRRLWLKVHVPEAHAAVLPTVSGAWFTVEGFPGVVQATSKQVVATAAVLDEASRTLPLFIAVDNAARRFRPGMFADVRVATGKPRHAITIPASAIVHESGLPTVYVQIHGEAFERRTVQLGPRDGAFVEVQAGVHLGERVVSTGAWAVRLAASSGAKRGHGHAH